MNKPIIGIIGVKLINEENPFLAYTKFVSNYGKRVREAGGIPIGLFEDINDDNLGLCDGFILQGGLDINDDYLKVLDYAFKNNKPLLGICLGVQAMGEYENETSNETLIKVDGHNAQNFELSKLDLFKHKIYLDKYSKIYDVYKEDVLYVPSVHDFSVDERVIKNKYFKITGRAFDGTTEVLESINDNWIVGVQFHPEIEDNNLVLFEELVKEAILNKH